MYTEDPRSFHDILQEYEDAVDELQDVLDSFAMARQEIETTVSDLADELEIALTNLEHCRKRVLHRKQMHRFYTQAEDPVSV